MAKFVSVIHFYFLGRCDDAFFSMVCRYFTNVSLNDCSFQFFHDLGKALLVGIKISFVILLLTKFNNQPRKREMHSI